MVDNIYDRLQIDEEVRLISITNHWSMHGKFI